MSFSLYCPVRKEPAESSWKGEFQCLTEVVPTNWRILFTRKRLFRHFSSQMKAASSCPTLLLSPPEGSWWDSKCCALQDWLKSLSDAGCQGGRARFWAPIRATRSSQVVKQKAKQQRTRAASVAGETAAREAASGSSARLPPISLKSSGLMLELQRADAWLWALARSFAGPSET